MSFRNGKATERDLKLVEKQMDFLKNLNADELRKIVVEYGLEEFKKSSSNFEEFDAYFFNKINKILKK